MLDRQLKLREQLKGSGRLTHNYLFCHPIGDPIRKLAEVYRRWRQTLQSLAIRYRKPYAARHSSVSWDLMLGRNPLFVARQHGHCILTMLTVYAAWTEGSLEADVSALRRAMRAPAYATRDDTPPSAQFGNSNAHSGRRSTRQKIRPDLQPSAIAPAPPAADLATNLPIAMPGGGIISMNYKDLGWRRGWPSICDPQPTEFTRNRANSFGRIPPTPHSKTRRLS